MVCAGEPSSDCALKSPWILAVRSAAAGPFPETSPTAKPKLPSTRSVKSKKSPPIDRDGSDVPIATTAVELDSRVARQVCAEDENVDRLNREIIAELTETMKRSPHLVQPAMHLFSASRHVERVADHATNIAEDVVYLVEGEIILEERGAGGFGYDPLFFLPGYQATMAELPEDVKNRLSHRGRAVEAARAYIAGLLAS